MFVPAQRNGHKMNQDSKLPLGENAGLMRKTADGDIDAFKRLHQRFAPLLTQFFVMRGVNRNSADDLVQIIFTHLWERRKNFRVVSSFEAYVFSMARNTLYQEIRQSHKKAGLSSKKHPKSDVDTHNILSQPEAEFYLQELTESLEAAKTKLTAKQYQALEFSQASEVPLSKILEELDCSHGAYKGLIKRARKQIWEFLDPIYLEEEKHKKRGKRP